MPTPVTLKPKHPWIRKATSPAATATMIGRFSGAACLPARQAARARPASTIEAAVAPRTPCVASSCSASLWAFAGVAKPSACQKSVGRWAPKARRKASVPQPLTGRSRNSCHAARQIGYRPSASLSRPIRSRPKVGRRSAVPMPSARRRTRTVRRLPDRHHPTASSSPMPAVASHAARDNVRMTTTNTVAATTTIIAPVTQRRAEKFRRPHSRSRGREMARYAPSVFGCPRVENGRRRSPRRGTSVQLNGS